MTKVVPLKGVRGMIADAMTKSLATAAQLTHHGSADATALMAEKTRLGEAGTKISVEDLLMLAVVRALKKNPDANGRVAPAMFGADAMDVTELRAARQDLATRAKINKLTVTEMTGGTFTVSNLGLTRVEHFTPIINAGQICILGIGRFTDRAVRGEDGLIELRPHVGLSLTFDHRALDGAPAGDLLTSICEEIEGMAV
jgi:pyruvate dehydrogenase E2 component (dihydrolipoamide acetyltransferase)